MEEYLLRLRKERSDGTETDPFAELEEILEIEYERETKRVITEEEAGEKAKADTQMLSRLMQEARTGETLADPDQDYLIDQKWMQYCDKYDLGDAETNDFANKAIKEYQEDLKTGYSHDGMVTLQELRQHAGQINSKGKKSDQFMKVFCRNIVSQMMIDQTFAGVLSKQSKEYELLAKEAEEPAPGLSCSVNIPAMEKVSNCVGRKERERVREDLKKHRRKAGEAWLLQLDKGGDAGMRWKETVSTDQLLPDPKSPSLSTESANDTADFVSETAGRILDYGRTLYENSYVKKLLQSQDGASDVYLDREMRSFIADAKAKCAYCSGLLDRMKQSPEFEKLAEEEQLHIREADRWITGYGRWFAAHEKQIRSWDRYFGAAERERKRIPYEELPMPLEKIPYYFK